MEAIPTVDGHLVRLEAEGGWHVDVRCKEVLAHRRALTVADYERALAHLRRAWQESALRRDELEEAFRQLTAYLGREIPLAERLASTTAADGRAVAAARLQALRQIQSLLVEAGLSPGTGFQE